MPGAALPGRPIRFQSPLFVYRKIMQAAVTTKAPTLYTAKDNQKAAIHLFTTKNEFQEYTYSRWYIKNKVHADNRKRIDGLYECILCASCTGSCPLYWWNRELFLGPAVLMQAYRWLIEPLDHDFDQRLDSLKHGYKLMGCQNIWNCSICCPKYLNPAWTIKEVKKLAVPFADQIGDPVHGK